MLLLLKRTWESGKYFAVLSRDTETLVRAFITYVRPLLEYCTPIWSPYSVGMIKRVESVQRAAITACNTGTVLVVKMTLKVS